MTATCSFPHKNNTSKLLKQNLVLIQWTDMVLNSICFLWLQVNFVKHTSLQYKHHHGNVILECDLLDNAKEGDILWEGCRSFLLDWHLE